MVEKEAVISLKWLGVQHRWRFSLSQLITINITISRDCKELWSCNLALEIAMNWDKIFLSIKLQEKEDIRESELILRQVICLIYSKLLLK